MIRFNMEPAEEELNENNDNNERVDVNPQPPFSGLYINVILKCPLRMAPYNLLKELEEKHNYSYTIWQGKKKPKGKFYLTLEFDCPSASDIHLPAKHLIEYNQEV